MKTKAVVVDTNLLFSALIPRASKIREYLLKPDVTFYAPNFLITEIYAHKEKLLLLSKLTEDEFYLFFDGLIERIKFLPISFISKESKQKAYELCKDIDVKDTPFVALAIQLNLPLWTGDKQLKQGLIAKGYDKFLGTI